MKTSPATVVIPTHNRPEATIETVARVLTSCERSSADVVVVDDGSTPALWLPDNPRLRILRSEGVERSSARNLGALAARGNRLIFIDDDITAGPDLVEQHIRAAEDFGDVIAVGKISLPEDAATSPFGRFRRTIEEPNQNRPRGVVAEENFCTAANMSISRRTFLDLGGFDPVILSGEDQDLALRFSKRGGQVVFLPEAEVIHRDAVADIATYSARHEWGARAMTPFLRRYPERPENKVRRRLGTPLRMTRFPAETVRVLIRITLSRDVPLGLIRRSIRAIEASLARDNLMFPMYRVLLGLHLFRGFRSGLAGSGEAPPLPDPLSQDR